MELSVESPLQLVTWQVHNFFQLPSEIGYSLESPEIRVADCVYYLRLLLNGSQKSRDGRTELYLERLCSTLNDNSSQVITRSNVSCKVGFRCRNKKGDEIDYYYNLNALNNNKLDLIRTVIGAIRDYYVPDGTFTVLCSMSLEEQSTGSSGAFGSTITEEKKKGLPGQCVLFSSCSKFSKMELSVESPFQHVKWKVPDLFQLLSKTGYSLNSSEFRFANDRYCLRFCSKGDKNGDTADTELQLVRLTSNFPERVVLYKVGDLRFEGLENEFNTYEYSNEMIDEFGFCLSRSQLERERDKYFLGGTFTVVCSMRLKGQCRARCPQSEKAGTYDAEEKQEGLPGKEFVKSTVQTEVRSSVTEEQNPKNEDWSSLSMKGREFVKSAVQTEVGSSVTEKENPKNEDWSSLRMKDVAVLTERMKELLIKGVDHDVTICVQNKEFRAHRNILSARSPVFAMMLAHDTKESNTNTINIEDCDPESFDEFLLYVYSGRTENLTPSNAIQLYYPADKYDFPELKEQCVNLLKTSLSVELFCDVVLLAAKHQEKELLEVATEFFAQNVKEILVTVGWLKFLSQNPIEANELHIKSLKFYILKTEECT